MTTPVEPVRAAAPSTGLLASAAPVQDPGARWETGFSWRPERCITTQGFGFCTEPTAPDTVDNEVIHYFPNAYRVWDECTTMAGERDADRLRRQAEAVASYEVAHELWYGDLSRANPGSLPGGGGPYVNPYLTDGNAQAVDVSTASSLQRAIAWLEQEAKVAAKGQQVYIHVPVRALDGDHYRRQGNLWYTPNDSILVADAGYGEGAGAYSPGTAEVQQVTIADADGGNFQLTYSGQTTIAIGYDSPPGDVQGALEALSNVEPGDVTVTGTPGNYTVTFAVTLGNVPEMTADGSGLTDSTGTLNPSATVTTTTEGAAPSNAAGLWAYATSPVQVRLGDIQVTQALPETVDRATNRQRIWADRAFAATFDPCVHFAADLSAFFGGGA